MKEVVSLVPTVETVDDIEGVLVDLIGKHQVDIKTMLDADSRAIEPQDMRYFGVEYWGRVPTYARFMYEVRKNVPEMANRLKYAEAEELGGKYERRMERIAEMPTDEMDGNEGKRFMWNEKLYKMQERKMDRIDKARSNDGVERCVDLTLKIISALSNEQLMAAKGIIDAEYKEISSER